MKPASELVTFIKKEKNFSNRDLAELLGVGAFSIRAWLKGIEPRIENRKALEKIAEDVIRERQYRPRKRQKIRVDDSWVR